MDFNNDYEPNKGENRNVLRYALIAIAIFSVVGLVILFYHFFIMTPQAKLLSGYHNLIKRMDSDYGRIQKKLGFDQDFSKEFHSVFTLENVEKGRFGQLLEGIESISVHLIQSDKHKQYQFLVTSKKIDGIYDLFGLQIGEEKIRMLYPEMNDKVYTLSAKNFGKEFNEVSRNLRLYYSQFSEVDFSYSSLRKMWHETYSREQILKRYLDFFEALFQDVNVKQTGDVYSCLIPSENVKRAAENAFNQAIKDFEEVDIYNSKGILELLKFNLINEIKDFSFLIETKLSDGIAKEFEMKILYFNDEMGRITFKTDAKSDENIFKAMELAFYHVDFEDSVSLKNVLEQTHEEVTNTISFRAKGYDEVQSDVIFQFKRPNSLNNFNFRIENFLNGESHSSLDLTGDYKTQKGLYSFSIPFIFYRVQSNQKIDIPLGMRYEVKQDTSGQWDFEKDRAEVKMVDMKKEDFEELLNEIEEFNETMLRINKI